MHAVRDRAHPQQPVHGVRRAARQPRGLQGGDDQRLLHGRLRSVIALVVCLSVCLSVCLPFGLFLVPASAGVSLNIHSFIHSVCLSGARCKSVVRSFAHGAMGCRIDPSWGGIIELFLVPPSAPTTGVTKAVVCVILSVGWCI